MPITQEKIDSLSWFHEFEFPNGLKAKTSHDRQKPFYVSRQAFLTDCIKRLDLSGKTVLDIGCWDGYYSFMCEQGGASKVYAIDQFSQNWGTKECFNIAKELKQSKVELLPDASVYEISSALKGQQFDVILFLGVFYHLHAPYLAISQLRSLCHEQSIIAAEGVCIRDEKRSYAEIVMDNPSKEKFVPTTKLIREMFKSCYFDVESELLLNDFAGQDLAKHLSQDQLFEVLQKNVKMQSTAAQLKDPAPAWDRVFLTAKPVAGKNSSHFYQPPFGLERFDAPDRFARPETI